MTKRNPVCCRFSSSSRSASSPVLRNCLSDLNTYGGKYTPATCTTCSAARGADTHNASARLQPLINLPMDTGIWPTSSLTYGCQPTPAKADRIVQVQSRSDPDGFCR